MPKNLGVLPLFFYNHDMNEEDRKAKARERMRVFRLRHANDQVYKARAKAEKKKQWAKNPEHHKEGNRKRMQRYRENHPLDETQKAKAAKLTSEWRDNNPERGLSARKAWQASNRAKVLEYLRQYRVENPRVIPREIVTAYAAARRTSKKRAMPVWADVDAIKSVYSEARKKTEETGTIWHVDHIVPLNNELVCGLHIAANLQLLPALVNLSKSNRFEV